MRSPAMPGRGAGSRLTTRSWRRSCPWVPYLWANAFTIVNAHVEHYVFDQFSGIISLPHISMA
jgi:hypothetical protein